MGRQAQLRHVCRLAQLPKQFADIGQLWSPGRTHQGLGGRPGQSLQPDNSHPCARRRVFAQVAQRRGSQVGRGYDIAQMRDLTNPGVHALGQGRQQHGCALRQHHQQGFAPIRGEVGQPVHRRRVGKRGMHQHCTQLLLVHRLLEPRHPCLQGRNWHFFGRPADQSTSHGVCPLSVGEVYSGTLKSSRGVVVSTSQPVAVTRTVSPSTM